MEARAHSLRAGDMTLERLFVYGTLRPSGQAFHLVEPLVARHQPGVLTGYMLVGEGHRYPWCVKSPRGEVAGELLWLRDPDGAFEILDHYEGLDDPEPEYTRVVEDVLTGNQVVPAWVYVGGPAVPGDAVVVEGGDWLT